MALPSPPQAPATGDVLAGQFRILRKLGQGGMGEVFLAAQAEIERQVVVKIVHAHLFEEHPDLGERLRREALIVGRVNHPHIVAVHLFGQTEDGRPYLVMEHVDGRSLTSEIRGPQISELRALRIAGQVCAALEEAHGAGIVHRDLKPDNVMLTERHGDPDYVKVLDFGIAKIVDRQDGKLTQTGSFCGTPQYAAPEQIQGGQVDGRADIYALGLILYEMLTGRVAFGGATPFEVLSHHVKTPAEAPSRRRIGSSLSPRTDALVLRCLEKDPAARFSSAVALRAEIDEAVAGLGTAPAAGTQPLAVMAPPPAPARRRGRGIVIGAGVLALLAVGAYGWRATRVPGKPPAAPAAPPATSAALQIAATTRCLNGSAARAYASRARYLGWVDPRVGPTGGERVIDGLTPVDGAAGCGQALAALTGAVLEPRMDRAARSYLAAVAALDPLAAAASAYYDAEDYRGDEMQRGQALHGPLVAAFERFARAELRLRAEVEAGREELDRQALQAPGLARALAELRIRTREALSLAVAPSARDGLAAARQAFSRALAATQLASEDPPLAKVIDAGRAFERALAGAPPAAVVEAHNAFADALAGYEQGVELRALVPQGR